jgi:Niemann-Pick C1 protein
VYRSNGTYCPPSEQHRVLCQPCLRATDLVNNRPTPDDFKKFLPMFLSSTECGQTCAVCGTPHYADVIMDPNNAGEVLVSRWRTYHSVLKTQDDYINALKSGRRIADEISAANGIPVFAYSVFYVFFEQYLYIEAVAWQNVGLAIGAIMLLCLFLLRNIWASAMIVFTIAMILTDLLGVMGAANVYLNAVSVVNIVMAIGQQLPGSTAHSICTHTASAQHCTQPLLYPALPLPRTCTPRSTARAYIQLPACK